MWYNTLLLGLEQKACEWWVLGWEKDRKKETLTQKKKKKKKSADVSSGPARRRSFVHFQDFNIWLPVIKSLL